MSNIIESGCGNVTTLSDDAVPDVFYVSDIAKDKITEILKDEAEGSFLRVGVYGGGCSGFQYMFGLHNELEEDDIILEWENGKAVVDSTSIQYLKGSTINFEISFGGEQFSVENPLATSECGCGSSFGYEMYNEEFGYE